MAVTRPDEGAPQGPDMSDRDVYIHEAYREFIEAQRRQDTPRPGFAPHPTPKGEGDERSEGQPDPIPNDRPAVWDLVIADMRARDHEGRRRYGVPLQPGNGRDALRDAYEEALDLAAYLRQAIAERDGEGLPRGHHKDGSRCEDPACQRAHLPPGFTAPASGPTRREG